MAEKGAKISPEETREGGKNMRALKFSGGAALYEKIVFLAFDAMGGSADELLYAAWRDTCIGG